MRWLYLKEFGQPLGISSCGRSASQRTARVRAPLFDAKCPCCKPEAQFAEPHHTNLTLVS